MAFGRSYRASSSRKKTRRRFFATSRLREVNRRTFDGFLKRPSIRRSAFFRKDLGQEPRRQAETAPPLQLVPSVNATEFRTHRDAAMSRNTTTTMMSPTELLGLILRRWALWTIPAVVGVVLAVGYVAVRKDVWEASQALVVRNDATSGEKKPGKFDQADDMKNVQETLLELAHGRNVLAAAMKKVGAPVGSSNVSAWPTDKDVDDFRADVKMTPPKGAEFGKTEVFYLTVRANDRERAVALNNALCDELQNQFRRLRDEKNASSVEELNKSVELAKSELNESTSKLAALEKEIGADLGELRSMQDIASSDSALRRSAEDARTQINEAKNEEKRLSGLHDVLAVAEKDPSRLVAAPNQLLESQPAIRRLKEGLIDAKLHTAQLQGKMSEEHPSVIAAKEAENEIASHLHDELATASRGIDVELKLNAERQKLLNERLNKISSRLEKLAEVRAEYENLAAENKRRSANAERAERGLSEAKASLASASAASLITRIDAPDAGSKPIGPGKTIVVASGALAGLFAGFGILFLTVPPVKTKKARNTRKYDYEDIRRAAIRAASAAAVAEGRVSVDFPEALRWAYGK